MKINQKGAVDLMLVAALVIVLLVGGFVLIRISDSNDTSTNPSNTTQNESQVDLNENESSDLTEYYAIADGMTQEGLPQYFPDFCDHSERAKRYILRGEEGTEEDLLFVESRDGKNIAWGDYEISGYFNYTKLYVNGELIEDNLISKYGHSGGLTPLFWTNDNNRLILRNYEVTGHGQQDGFVIYEYDVTTSTLRKLAQVEGTSQYQDQSCDSELMYLTHSSGGAYGYFSAPHAISQINLSTGEVTELFSSNSATAVPGFTQFSLSEDENELTYSLRILSTLPENEFYDQEEIGYTDEAGSIAL